MAGLGLIATGAALLNYNKAKSEYDSLIEQRDGLMAAYDAISVAVNKYNKHKDDPDYGKIVDTELKDIDTKPNAEFPEGFYVTTILRVGNLGGKLMRARTSIVFVNDSDETVTLVSAQAECKVLNYPIIIISAGLKDHGRQIPQIKKFGGPDGIGLLTIAPGVTVEVELDGGASGLSDMDALRKMVCDAAGKKLITSCPKMNITDGEKADYSIYWRSDKQEGLMHTYRIGVPGVLRYCGEGVFKL